MSLLTADQEKMVEYLRMNFGKPSDTALFTSLKTIYDNSAYTSATESNQVLVLSNTTSLMNSLGIPGGMSWSWIVDQISANNYTLTVVSSVDKTQMGIMVQPYPSGINIKTFLTTLHNAFGLENFQFRCIDQRDNQLGFRMGRFPTNFLTLFPTSTYRFEIRPVFCDNFGCMPRNHKGTSTTGGGPTHKARTNRILQKYGRGSDPNITLPLHLNSALSLNEKIEHYSENGGYKQMDATEQARFVDRAHNLLSNPLYLGGYGKAKLLNGFQDTVHDWDQTHTVSGTPGSSGYVCYLTGKAIADSNSIGPYGDCFDQTDDTACFEHLGLITHNSYVYPVSVTEINSHKSDTPAGDSDFHVLPGDLANFCRYKRHSMRRHLGGNVKRSHGNNMHYRIQYTMALVIGKYVTGHGKPCAIIPDQGRFYDFEENNTTTVSLKNTGQGIHTSLIRLSNMTDLGLKYIGSSVTHSGNTYTMVFRGFGERAADGNKFVGIHVGTRDSKGGFLKKASVSGNLITVGGYLYNTSAAQSRGATPITLTINTQIQSSYNLSITSQSGVELIIAAVCFDY